MTARLNRLYNTRPFSSYPINLHSYWRLEEASGNRADAKGSNTLTASGSPGNVAAVQGSGATFNGTSDFLFCNSASDLVFTGVNTAFMIGAWVYPAVINASKPIIYKQDTATTLEYRLLLISNASFGFAISPDGSTVTSVTYAASTIPTANAWYFVVAGYDPISKRIYCHFADANGLWREPVTTAYTGAGAFNGTSKLRVGHDAPNARFWNGRIDEAFVAAVTFKRKVQNHFLGGGSGRAYPPLVA